MKIGSLLRGIVVLVVTATLAGTTDRALAEEVAAPKSDVVWKQIGEGTGIVGMATVGGKLFACTANKKLQVCDPAVTPVAWKTIGDCPPTVVAMGVADGKLFASTSTRLGSFHMRDAVDGAAEWQHIGHCWCAVGLAGTVAAPGKIFGAIAVNNGAAGIAESIMVRDATPTELPWKSAVGSRAPAGIIAFTELDGKFYAATRQDVLHVGDVTKADVAWQPLGDAPGFTVLAGGDGKLLAATRTGKLLMCEPRISK